MKSQRMCLPTIAASSLLLLAACGGGGGGDSAPPPVAQEITTTNMQPTAAMVVNTVDASSALAGIADSFAGVSSSNRVPLAASIAGQAPPTAAQMYDTTQACTGGGSIAVSLNDADNNMMMSGGDTARLSFSACSESGTVMTGMYSLTVNSASGSFAAGTGQIGLSVAISNLVGIQGSERSTMNGNATLSIVQSSTTDSVASMSLSNMVVGTAGGTSGSGSVTIPSATLSATRVGMTTSLTFSEQLAVQHSAYTGSISVVAEQPVYYANRTDAYPSSGRIRTSTSTGKSTLWLTYLGGDAATLDLDSNGDGTIETTQSVKLSDLQKL